MTSTPVTQPRTALELLCGTHDDAPQTAAAHVLAPALREKLDKLTDVPQALRPAAAGAIAAAAAGLLGFGLIELVLDAWSRHRDLQAAARRTLAVTGTTELVRPPPHRITVTRQPYIRILVNGEEVAKVELDLTLIFDISAMVAEVSAGRLTALHTGRCLVNAELAIYGVVVLTRSADIDLPGAISLRGGLRLLPERDYAAQKQEGK